MRMFNGDFKRFFYTPVGRIIISLLLGLGIATLFRKVCRDKNCIEFRGPTISAVEGKIFQSDDKCYTYQSRAAKCQPEKKTMGIVPDAGEAIAPSAGAAGSVAAAHPLIAAASAAKPAPVGNLPVPIAVDASGGNATTAPQTQTQTQAFAESAAGNIYSFFAQRFGGAVA